jgi:Spondin_N
MCAFTVMIVSASVRAEQVKVKVENLNSVGGVYLAPTWVGFHDGSYDVFDVGVQATAGLKRLAEDGAPDILGPEFAAAEPGGLSGVITDPSGVAAPPVFDPGHADSMTFDVNPTTQRYFSFAAMVVPSNDAFTSKDDPIALFDAGGNFLGPIVITLTGNDIWDAGSEQNTEMDAAFINQVSAGDGIDTTDGVSLHPGYIGSERNPGGTPIILGHLNASGNVTDSVLGDFTRDNGTVPQFRITITPEPASAALVCGLVPWLVMRRRRSCA